MFKLKYYLKKKHQNFISKYNNKKYSEMLYEKAFKEPINWENPTHFNEKLMWLKVNIYNNDPTVWIAADKYFGRTYAISKGIKEKHLPEIIDVCDYVNEIDKDKLPDKFVLKCSHGYGFNIICTDKSKFDFEENLRKINRFQKTKFGYETGEIHYTHINPKIIVEKYIDDEAHMFPYDYKIYCFFGKPQVILVCSEREKKLKLNFFDLKWQELMLGKKEDRSTQNLKMPRYFKDMIGIAKRVSKDFPFVRIDFYEDKNHAIMGHMTFTPSACLASYYSAYGDKYLSDLLDLKKIKGDQK